MVFRVIIIFSSLSFLAMAIERHVALRLFLRAGSIVVTERTASSARTLFVQLWAPAVFCE
eukprot:COSAG04_NODE_304_length_17311_cov_13.648792_17_plen_60_part_00